MNRLDTALNLNPLVKYLNKTATDITKADIIRFIENNGIEMVNFRYVGGDGRLKTLNFVINSKKHLDEILSSGERIDGSSLFSYIEAGSSDLYVIPKFRTAFVNPFTEIPTLDILCSYYNKDGLPLSSSPENIMNKAHNVLYERTGLNFEAMGELEYYLISPKTTYSLLATNAATMNPNHFPNGPNFAEAMKSIAQAGGQCKIWAFRGRQFLY